MRRQTLCIFALSAIALSGCQKNEFNNSSDTGDVTVRYAVTTGLTTKAESAEETATEISDEAEGTTLVLSDASGNHNIPMGCEVTEGISGNAVSAVTKGTQVNTTDDDYKTLETFADIVGSFVAEAYDSEGTQKVSQTVTWDESSNAWVGSPVTYWPQATSLNFLAYANLPGFQTAAITSTGVSTEHTVPATASEQTDILFGHYSGNGGNTGTAEIRFDHPLTAVRFKCGSIGEGLVIQSISLSGVAESGTATKSPDGIITWGGVDSHDYTVSQSDGSGLSVDATTSVIGEPFLIIPQNLAENNVTVKVTFTDGAEVMAVISDGQWRAGYTNTYGLSMSQSQIIYHWNDSGRSTHTHPHTGDAEIFEQTGMIESGIYDITLHEPLWEPENLDDYYKFLGWATSSTATAAEYVQQGRSQSTGLPYQISVHSETVDLYAVWEKVDNLGAWVDYQAYNMNAFDGFRFDHIDSWEFNKSFAFTSSVSRGFEKIGFPIHNLEVGRWYTITFSEDVLPHEKAYNVQSGVFGNTVHESSKDIKLSNKGSMITYTTDATSTKPVIHAWTHTVSDNTWGENAVHMPMSNQQTTFYASAETMWWIWDLSKICDYEQKQYHISHAMIEMMEEPTGPAIDFRNASFHGFKFKAFNGDEDDHSDSSADNKGRSTYKVKSDFTSSEMKMWGTGSYEKINIPLINLEPGATYKLSFNYTLEALYCSDSPIQWPDNDFCFGVRPEKNTKTSRGNFKDTEGYSRFITTNIADCQNKYMEMTFTVPADKNTMYFIWSLSGLSDHTFFHQLITNAKLEKL